MDSAGPFRPVSLVQIRPECASCGPRGACETAPACTTEVRSVPIPTTDRGKGVPRKVAVTHRQETGRPALLHLGANRLPDLPGLVEKPLQMSLGVPRHARNPRV